MAQPVSGWPPEAVKACSDVRQARLLVKSLLILLGAQLALYEMWAIDHAQRELAAAIIAVAVFGACGSVEKWQEDRTFFGFLNLRKRSWGFFAMGTLLAWAAWIEADNWPKLRAPRWLHSVAIGRYHLPYDVFQTWGWWVAVLAAIFLYVFAVFRPGEARNYPDYLRFNSWGKLTHDFVAVKVSFVVVPCMLALWIAGSWSNGGSWWRSAPLLVSALVAVWGLVLGFWMDLKRLEGKFICPMSRDEIHIQGTPLGPMYTPELAKLRPRQAIELIRYERELAGRITRPG